MATGAVVGKIRPNFRQARDYSSDIRQFVGTFLVCMCFVRRSICPHDHSACAVIPQTSAVPDSLVVYFTLVLDFLDLVKRVKMQHISHRILKDVFQREELVCL